MAYTWYPNVPTTALLLTDNSSSPNTCVIPVNEDFVISSSQEINRPIEELFKKVKDIIVASANVASSSFAGVAKAGLDLQDLLGYRLGGKAYYASAWKGVKSNGLEIKLDFKWGWRGMYDAYNECYIPAYTLMSGTVPSNPTGLSLLAPMPAAIDVYTGYGVSLLGTSLAQASNGATSVLANLGSAITGLNNAKDVASSLSIKADGSISLPRTWKVNFGFYNGSEFISIIDLGENIVESSRLTQGNQMQADKDNNKYYPINTSLSLTMVAENVYTSSMFSSSGFNDKNNSAKVGG